MQFQSKKAKPWMRRHKIAGRFYALFLLLVGPVVICAVAVWDERDRFKELSDIFRATFGKWVDEEDK